MSALQWASGVVEERGAGIVALVMAAGVAKEAATRAVGRAQALRDQDLLRAVTVLVQSFNQLSTALAEAHSWTREELLATEAELELAFAKALRGPSGELLSGGDDARIILQ